tara:strand:+ start:209 stop:508 length:300 start_codon:yes stop_codon:yes gene_type:complete
MINKKYLIEVWNSVWEEGLTELEVQKRYFTKLDKKLKGEDRFHLRAIKTKIDELENGLQNFRTDGDGTEWLIEKDETGKVYKRAIGSDAKIYINNSEDN